VQAVLLEFFEWLSVYFLRDLVAATWTSHILVLLEDKERPQSTGCISQSIRGTFDQRTGTLHARL
jgi:hypothetical protein